MQRCKKQFVDTCHAFLFNVQHMQALLMPCEGSACSNLPIITATSVLQVQQPRTANNCRVCAVPPTICCCSTAPEPRAARRGASSCTSEIKAKLEFS